MEHWSQLRMLVILLFSVKAEQSDLMAFRQRLYHLEAADSAPIIQRYQTAAFDPTDSHLGV